MSVTFTIGAILLQLGAGYINSRRQCKLSNDMAAAQKKFEEKATLHGIENARNEYRQLCGLQREIEIRMQQDRIQQIRDNFYSNLDIIAYSESLKNFPLLVPPFVMKNESLPLLSGKYKNNASKEKVAMHCILTNCTDTQFNVKIFPELEERLSGYFCEYWNIGSPHSVLFYQGGWKDSTKDARPYISNLKSELRTLPTLVISPVITENDGLQFLFSCWGMGTEQEFSDNSIFVPHGLKFEYKPNYPYSDEEKESVLNELVPSLEAFISFFADVYYWFYYGTPPLLPSLMKKNCIKLSLGQCDDYKCQYLDILQMERSTDIFSYSNKTYYNQLLYIASLINYVSEKDIQRLLIDLLYPIAKLNGFCTSDYDDIDITDLICCGNVLESLTEMEIELFNEINSHI